MRNLILTSLFWGLSACSTYSKRQCQEMNWEAQGVQTAMKGEYLAQGLDHFHKVCLVENGIKPDEQGLRRGYDIGLKQFCTPEFAYSLRGGRYSGVCPAEAEQAIKPKLQDGRMSFLERKVVELESEVSSLEGQISTLRGELSDAQGRAAIICQ